MKRLCIALLVLECTACGPSYGGQDVKTPDEIVAEQEQIAAQQEQEKKEHPENDTADDVATDAEKRREFDEKQTKLELERATNSAESCPGVVAGEETKDHPRGDTRVTVTFQEDGTVKDVSIPSPFDGTPIGDCVIRAYKAVIVPPYTGGDKIIDWDVSLKDKPGADKSKKKGKGGKSKKKSSDSDSDSDSTPGN